MSGIYEIIIPGENHLPEMYSWNKEEKNFLQFTCRPIGQLKTYEEYKNKTLSSIAEGKDRLYILINTKTPDIPVGRIRIFDYNPRNLSCEFGYYMPEKNRGLGLGSIMINLFLSECFNDKSLNLNKIYATTASNNNPSIKVLEKAGFKLEGRLREHYFIHKDRFDQLIFSILRREWER